MARAHYVLVEVRSDLALKQVREAIHETGANVGDIVLRGDRKMSYYGHDITVEYGILSRIFHRHMDAAKRARND